MSAPTTATPARRRWPYVPGQARLLGASLIALVAAFLPWLSLPFGDIGGMQGAGRVTFYVAFMGLAGGLLRHRRWVLGHMLAVGAVFVGLPLWQVVRAGSLLGWRGWVPGNGLLLTFAAGTLALTAAAAAARSPAR